MLLFNTIPSICCFLIAHKFSIGAAEGQQLRMRSPFNDEAFIKHQNQIGIAYCAQPVSDHNACTRQIAQIPINDAFCKNI